MSLATGQIGDLAAEFRQASERARKLWTDASTDRLKAAPGPGRWPAVLCVEHLSITTRAFLPLIDGALEELRRMDAKGSGPFKMDLGGRLLKWYLEPPYKRLKSKTPATFEPPVRDPGEVLDEFLRLQGAIEMRLAEADGYALDRVRIVSPFSRHVKYNLYSTFCVMAAHERRHLWQAEEAAGVRAS